MHVTAIVPFRATCDDRSQAWDYVRARMHTSFPSWSIVEATHDGEPFSKAEAVMRAVYDNDCDVVVVHDADVIVDGIDDCIYQLTRHYKWAIPHLHVYRLTRDATQHLFRSGHVDGKEVVEQHRGAVGGGVVVVDRDTLLSVPFDVRFRGWGGEDLSWGYAMRTLIGLPYRYSYPMYHLWHEPAPRMNRVIGSEQSAVLLQQYLDARNDRDAMQRIVDDAQQALVQIW